MSTGIEAIAAERQRQIDAEGWTPEHDDEHMNGEMATAAGLYALHAARDDSERAQLFCFPDTLWPWSRKWWKPKDRRADLVRAGALIAAEIDRLDRAEKTVCDFCGYRAKNPCASRDDRRNCENF